MKLVPNAETETISPVNGAYQQLAFGCEHFAYPTSGPSSRIPPIVCRWGCQTSFRQEVTWLDQVVARDSFWI